MYFFSERTLKIRLFQLYVVEINLSCLTLYFLLVGSDYPWFLMCIYDFFLLSAIRNTSTYSKTFRFRIMLINIRYVNTSKITLLPKLCGSLYLTCMGARILVLHIQIQCMFISCLKNFTKISLPANSKLNEAGRDVL